MGAGRHALPGLEPASAQLGGAEPLGKLLQRNPARATALCPTICRLFGLAVGGLRRHDICCGADAAVALEQRDEINVAGAQLGIMIDPEGAKPPL